MFKSLSLLKQLLVVILGLAIMLVAVVMPVEDSNVHDIIDVRKTRNLTKKYCRM